MIWNFFFSQKGHAIPKIIHPYLSTQNVKFRNFRINFHVTRVQDLQNGLFSFFLKFEEHPVFLMTKFFLALFWAYSALEIFQHADMLLKKDSYFHYKHFDIWKSKAKSLFKKVIREKWFCVLGPKQILPRFLE